MTGDYIRRVFNELDFVGRADRGDLQRSIYGYNHHLTKKERQRLREPVCTRSQVVRYSELDGKPVAIVHQRRRADGTLGASGRPDPKRIILFDRTIADSPNRPPDHFE